MPRNAVESARHPTVWMKERSSILRFPKRTRGLVLGGVTLLAGPVIAASLTGPVLAPAVATSHPATVFSAASMRAKFAAVGSVPSSSAPANALPSSPSSSPEATAQIEVGPPAMTARLVQKLGASLWRSRVRFCG